MSRKPCELKTLRSICVDLLNSCRFVALTAVLLLGVISARFAMGNPLSCPQLIETATALPENETEIPIDRYQSANTRPLEQYEYLLGPKFAKRFSRARHILDVGGGYGLAVLKRVQADDVTTGVVINAQDAWKDVTDETPTAPYLLNQDKLLTLALRAGIQLNAADPPVFSPGWDIAMRARLRGLFNRLNTRFVYTVGLAEDRLPQLKTKFDVITDVFGAYYYSKNRLDILDDYYSHLADDGSAFLVIGSTDHMFTGHDWNTYTHRPENIVHLPNRDLSLEGYLVLQYPSVFRIISAGGTSSSVTTVMIMKKNPRIAALHLRSLFNSQVARPDQNDGRFSAWRRRVPNLDLYPTGPVHF